MSPIWANILIHQWLNWAWDQGTQQCSKLNRSKALSFCCFNVWKGEEIQSWVWSFVGENISDSLSIEEKYLWAHSAEESKREPNAHGVESAVMRKRFDIRNTASAAVYFGTCSHFSNIIHLTWIPSSKDFIPGLHPPQKLHLWQNLLEGKELILRQNSARWHSKIVGNNYIIRVERCVLAISAPIQCNMNI